ncbi:MAG TPA: cytochrome C [Methylomirabilota bacterium]|nr:cytochrome C [Methylomirabilota bacterium]
MLRKILLALLGLVALLVAAGAIFVASRQHLKFDAPFPSVAASTDTAVIARGRYIVRDITNCAQCHGDPAQHEALVAGADVPLSGGFTFDIPPGKIRVRNITPDEETGIGKVPDGAIARALRNGIGPDGRALLPFMEMQGLSDDDLLAVISYLRSQPPVHNLVAAHSYTVLGAVVKATILANPVGPAKTPPATSPRGATLENGRYLVESVALCWACHTQRDLKTGTLVGPRYGGNSEFQDDFDHTRIWAPPNITSDPATGRLGSMTEDDFVNRFRGGRLIPGSPMPWQGFSRMAEEDLRAMYMYLKSLPPVSRDVGPPLREVAAKK